jgi:hypothetical protein
MRIIGLEEILAALDETAALAEVARGFQRHARGEAQVDHGEAGWAVRAGLVDSASLIELAALLAAPVAFGAQETVVADLTGVAIQDFEIAKSVWQGLPPA